MKDNNTDATINTENCISSSIAADDEGQDLHTKVEGLKLRSEEVFSNSIQYAEQDIAADNFNRGGNSKTDNVGFMVMENGRSLSEDTEYSRNSVGAEGVVISQEDSRHKLEQAQMSLQGNSSQASIQLRIFVSRPCLASPFG